MTENKDRIIQIVILFEEFIDSYSYTPEFLDITNIHKNNRKKTSHTYNIWRSDITDNLFSLEDFKDSLYLPDNFFINNNYDWDLSAAHLSNFIDNSLKSPENLQNICDKYSRDDLFKDIPLFSITRVLNALNSQEFIIINQDSLKLINYLEETSYSLTISDYHSINSLGKKIVKKLISSKNISNIPFLSDSDIFYYFCDWLYRIKNINNTSLTLEIKTKQKYTIMQLTENTYIEQKTLEKYLKTLKRKKQIIFQGSPGTGKTYLAKHIAQHLTSSGDGFFELIQFHPTYSYEDFIQGIRPQTSPDGNLEYSLIPGRFLDFCKKAETCQDICILIIDEINRTNLSQVFGELMYLLEYREEEINLAGSNQPFKIPENVYIIGTMNTADRSIALVDHALRRRFAFITIKPNYEILRKYNEKHNPNFPTDNLIKILENLNQTINDPHYEIGVSFFLTPTLEADIQDIWTMEIEPYLEEYFFDETDKIDQFSWDKIKSKLGFNYDNQ